MAIELATKFQPYVDEKFSTESKKSLLTNNDFDWTGAHTVKVYKISTALMNDYDRNGAKKATQSVSYTHLDVYKRQTLCPSRIIYIKVLFMLMYSGVKMCIRDRCFM